MEKKQRFSIKKYSIGVVSVCIGFAFLAGPTASVQADELVQPTTEENIEKVTSLSNQETAQESPSLVQNEEGETLLPSSPRVEEQQESVGTDGTEPLPVATTDTADTPIQTEGVRSRSRRSLSDTTSPSPEDTALRLLENHATLTPNRRIAELTEEEKTELKGILFTNFETKVDQVALTGVVTPRVKADSPVAAGLTGSETATYYAPELGRLKRESGVTNPTPEMIRQATAFAVDAVNRVLYQDATLEALAPAAKSTFEKLLSHNQMEVLTSQTGLTIAQLKNDLPALYRAVLFLEQQYSFEDDLVHTLVFSPEQINNRPSDGRTAYDRLVIYGGKPTDKLRQMSMLYNRNQFRDRRVGEFTGTNSPEELIEVLSRKRNQDPATYFEERTEAVVGASAGLRVYDLLKVGQPDYLLPLLSQGKGLYAAGATKSVTIGMLDSYKKLYDDSKLLPHVRGTAQDPQPFFQGILPYQENWLRFLESVKKPGTEVPITLAVDTMRVYRPNAQNPYVWSAEAGVNAAPAVVSFFSPMRLWQTEVNMEGQASSEALIRAFSRHFMHPNLSGVRVYTHEMTHTNDQVRLFGGVYRTSGRRSGQGPEVYARGLFEVVNNSQTGPLAEKPVFTLNTAIPITDAANQRTQASQPHTSKETLEVYMKNLMDLVAYLEAVEAKVALATLTDEEEALYFNRVSQVEREKNPQSTNDAFLPFGKQGAPAYVSATSVADLVDQDAVSGQFIPSSLTPFHDNLKHNDYYAVPLLESFYAVSQAEDGKNTVGDVSFRRHAYEILGWKGWDAFVTYLSDQTSSDREAFKLILKDNQGDWASFKKAQYERLSKAQLVTNLESGKELEDKLKKAIQTDLQTIKEYRRQLELRAVQPAFLPLRATAVRAVKFAVLNEALQLNDLKTSVLKEEPTETKILYVKNNGGGNGLTPDSPLSSLAEAVQKAKDGYIIRLVGNVTERLPLRIDKEVTIESEGTSPYALTFNAEIEASQHVTFKQLTLKGILDGGASGPIYLEKGAVFDSVSTLISPRQSDQRPSLIIGGKAGAVGTETAGVRIINANDTVFDTITVKQPTNLHFDSNIKVLTSVQITTDQPVAVTSASNHVRSIQATDPSRVTVTLDRAFPTALVLENIHTLHLTNGSQVSLSEAVGSPIADSLMLDPGTRLHSPVALAFETLSGGGELEFPIELRDDALKVTRVTPASGTSSSEASPAISFQYSDSPTVYDGVTFVRVAESSTVAPTVKLKGTSDIALSAQPDATGTSYTYQAGYSNYYVFEPEDDQLTLPDGLMDLTPENQTGSPTPLPVPLPPERDSYTDPTTNESWEFVIWDVDKENSNGKRTVYVGIWRRVQDSPKQKTHTVTLDFVYNGQSVATHTIRDVADKGAISSDTVTHSLPSVEGGRYAILERSDLSQLTDITSDRRVSIPLTLWHTVTLKYMAGSNELLEKTVSVKHGDTITKNTVTQSLPHVERGRYAISEGSDLSQLTDITSDRRVSIPLTLWHTVTLEYMAGSNELLEKIVNVKHGDAITKDTVSQYIPQVEGARYAILEGSDLSQLANITSDRRVSIPLTLWHTVTLEYMAGSNRLLGKTVDVKHGDAITKDTVSQYIPQVERGHYATSNENYLSQLTDITSDRQVSIPLTLWHTVTLEYMAGSNRLLGKTVDVKHGDTITKNTVTQSLPHVERGRYAISEGSDLSQLTDITSDRRVSIPLTLWHTVTLEYMAGSNELLEKTVNVKHGDAITKDTVSQYIPQVERGHYATSNENYLSQLTDITSDRQVSIPLTLWHTVTLKYMAGSNELLEKTVDVKYGENVDMKMVRDHVPDGYIISDTFPDQPQLNGVRSNQSISVPLVKLFDKTAINRVEIVTKPTKVAYDEGELMDLTSLVLKLTDKHNLIQHVSPQDFATFGVDVSPTLSTPLAKTVDKLIFRVDTAQAELPISVYQLVSQELPFSTVYEADKTLPANTRMDKQSGSKGRQTVRMLNGKQVGDSFDRQEPTPHIVLVGTAPTRVDSKPLPFDKEEKRDASLAVEASYLKQVGKNGSQDIWRTYDLNTETGELTSKEETVIEQPVSQVAIVGTRIEPQRIPVQRIDLIFIQFKTKEIPDPSLPLGTRRVVQEGKAGQRYQTVTITDIVDGKEVIGGVEAGEVLVSPTEEIVHVGTGPLPNPLPQPLPDSPPLPSDTSASPSRPSVTEQVIVSSSRPSQVEKPQQLVTPEKSNHEWKQAISSVSQKNLPNTGVKEENHLVYLGALSGMLLLAARSARKRKS